MPSLSNDRAKELIQVADKAFNTDGGLGYTDRVLKGLQDNDLRFNASEACMVLVVLHRSLLQEYGRLVAQLEAAVTQVIPIGPLSRG